MALLTKYKFISRTDASFNLSYVSRVPDYPVGSGDDTDVLFYVTHPTLSTTVLRKVLASILLSQEKYLESVLNQYVELQTSAAPYPPPNQSLLQMRKSIIIRISSFRIQLVSGQNTDFFKFPISGHRSFLYNFTNFANYIAKTFISLSCLCSGIFICKTYMLSFFLVDIPN